MSYLVGNDIVSLLEPGVIEKFKDSRFTHRVLTPQELHLLFRSKHPEILLWMFWSAKEAAYKILKKKIPTLIFAHKKFQVIPYSLDKLSPQTKGLVFYDHFKIIVSWDITKHWVHCLGQFKIKKNHHGHLIHEVKHSWELDHDASFFSDQEKKSISHLASAQVRIQAKNILASLGFNHFEIVRLQTGKSFGPPEIQQNGEKMAGFDISLSHDGPFLACYLSIDDTKIATC